MYPGLMPGQADRYHVIAPDYPGYGYSEAPGVGRFTYRISPGLPKAAGT
jgi:pimeloyl-ACP methyl ester carboxylesterase